MLQCPVRRHIFRIPDIDWHVRANAGGTRLQSGRLFWMPDLSNIGGAEQGRSPTQGEHYVNKDEIAGVLNSLKTSGVGSFGGEEGGTQGLRLFRVEPGHSADYALAQSCQLIACVRKLTFEAGIEQDATLAMAAHFLSGMANALVEDVAHSMMVAEQP